LQRLSYTRFGFYFAVYVTEMAELGPWQCLFPYKDLFELPGWLFAYALKAVQFKEWNGRQFLGAQ
jgi:hypothetical protein